MKLAAAIFLVVLATGRAQYGSEPMEEPPMPPEMPTYYGRLAAEPQEDNFREENLEAPTFLPGPGARVSATHADEEMVAQASCEALMVSKNLAGWVYAVERVCGTNQPTCIQICASCYLKVQDSQTVFRTWSTIGAFHVYKNRPSTTPGTNTNAKLGLKSYWSPTYHTSTSCGPNFCCCRAV